MVLKPALGMARHAASPPETGPREALVQLPYTLRESLVEELDEYIEGFGSDPEPEALVAYVIELLETFADEEGWDDLKTDLEESGALDESLADALEAEITSNDEFEYTGEEVVSLLESLCEIEWDEEDEDEDDLDDDEEDDEDEDEDF